MSGRAPFVWGGAQIAVAAAVVVYLVGVLVVPLGALVVEVVQLGWGATLGALWTPEARDALLLTLLVTLNAVIFNAVFGTIGALILVRHRFWGRAFVEALVDIPLAVAPVMAGLAMLTLFGRGGWLAPLTGALGLKIAFAPAGVALATLFVTLPFTVREVAHVLEELGTSEEEAAATLGASTWGTFWRVTLPNLRNALGVGLTLTVARSLGEFGAGLVLGGAITGHTETATTFIHTALEERQEGAAYAMALVLAGLSMVILLLLQRLKPKRAR